MSDTPETDAKASPHIGFFSCASVPAEFARKLERERDEAIENLKEEMKWHHRTHAELVQIQCKLLDTERERDDLRDRLNELLNRPPLV
jgi:chromosome segregation ATPase